MNRRGFWLGLLAGMIVMGLLVATAAFVFMRFRGFPVAIYGLRGRQFGVNPRGWFYPRTLGRWHGFGALLCGPVLLLAGAVVLGALLGKHWRRRRQGGASQGSVKQATPVSKAAEAEQEPPAVSTAAPVEPAPPVVGEATSAPEAPPAEPGQGEAQK